MTMAMVQVRHVTMLVGERFVAMEMGVRLRRQFTGLVRVRVLMMRVVHV